MATQHDAQSPTEQYGGAIEKQIALQKRALEYTSRFSQPQPTSELDARFAEISRAAGVTGGRK
jgi:hypothetical protein